MSRTAHKCTHLRIEIAAELQNCKEILLHREPAKDGRLLREIAQPEARARVHGGAGQIDPVEMDGSAIGGNETDDHVKARGLARAVGTEETHHLSTLDGEAHVVDDRARAETLCEPFGGEAGHYCLPWSTIVTRRFPSSVSAPSPLMLPVTES